jgi:transposase
MTARRGQVQAAEWFGHPQDVNHRRYEALRAYFVDGLTVAQAAERFGYAYWTMANLVRDFNDGKLAMFAPPAKPGPAKGAAPARDRVRGRAVELRREGLSVYEISARLAAEGTPLNRTSVGEVLREEGFAKLVRRPGPDQSASPTTPGRAADLPPARALRVSEAAAEAPTRFAGLLLALPDLAALGLPEIVADAGYPSTKQIRAENWILSLLALKLTGLRRVSHVDDLLQDPAAALFAGMANLPKKTALTDYSYRTGPAMQDRLLLGVDAALVKEQLATGAGAVLDLDFHAVMHWGKDPALEKHYVPTRSQRSRSVLTFFAQDHSTKNLLYSTADLAKATQAGEVLDFCDHWKAATGQDPATVVMDQKVTTHKVLGELDRRGVKFLTLRMRSKPLMERIAALGPKDFKTVSLDRPGPHNRPKVNDDPAARISDYPGTVRQLTVTGLGRDAPTVIITNDRQSTARQLLTTYAGRMNIEQRLAEIIRSFHTDALSSAVALNADLDMALCVLAQNTIARLAGRLPGYTGKTPDTIQRRFLETPGAVAVTPESVTVTLDRRTYSPVLRKADLPQNTPIPWLNGRTINFQLN